MRISNTKIRVFVEIALFLVLFFAYAYPTKAQAQTQPPQTCNYNTICEGAENQRNCPNDCAGKVIAEDTSTLITTIWNNKKAELNDAILSWSTDSRALYDFQFHANNLLLYTRLTKDYTKMEDIAGIMMTAHAKLTTSPSGRQRWMDANGVENITETAQYIYFVATAINVFSEIPLENRQEGTNIYRVLNEYKSIVVQDNLLGWLYEDAPSWHSASGCSDSATLYKAFDFVKKQAKKDFSTNPPYQFTYCNSIRDDKQQMAGTAAEILAANHNHPSLVPLTTDEKTKLANYVKLMNAYIFGGTLSDNSIIESRLTDITDLYDYQNRSVTGTVLDLDGWYLYPDYYFSDKTTSLTGIFPGYKDADNTNKPFTSAHNTGWDLSHAKRQIWIMDSLSRSKTVTGAVLPNDIVYKKFVNQLVYKIFDKNYDNPQFTNYMSGVNGWYRVNYDDREKNLTTGDLGTTPCRGLPPYASSESIPTGGFGFWQKYNSDMATLYASLYRLYTSTDTHYEDLRAADARYFWGNLLTPDQCKIVGGIVDTEAYTAKTWDQLAFLPTMADSCSDCPLIKLTNSVDKPTAMVGDILTYTTHAKNISLNTALATVVTSPIPVDTEYIAGSANEGGVFANNKVTWNLNSLAPGTEKNLIFQVRAL